ncbi:MAG: hypothetical protein ACP5F3_01025 [Candidatus Syntrophosphaera sp.]
MKKTAFYLLLLAALIFLAACQSGGEFRVINRTSFPLYVALEDADEVAIPGGEEETFSVDTEGQHIFNPGVEKEVGVRMIGETYQIWDDYQEAYTDSTTVKIKVGETTSAFIDPNRAGFKVVNNSSQAIVSAQLYRHNFVASSFVADLGRIEPGEFKFLCVNYATPNNNFYYLAVLETEDEATHAFGDDTNVIQEDEQFLITLEDPQD